MILSISKKVTLIYSLISNFFILLAFQPSFGADDVASFCFEPNVSLKSVKHSIEFILLEKDVVSFREEDHCLDIVASEARKNILEKYLSKRYSLLSSQTPRENGECHIELKTIKKKSQAAQDFKVGEKNNLVIGESSINAVTTSEMLLGEGRLGRLLVGAQSLQVECHSSKSGTFELIFYFEEKNKAVVSTSAHLAKNEVINIATVTATLDEKNKMLGIPQTAIGNTQGNEETIYELKVY